MKQKETIERAMEIFRETEKYQKPMSKEQAIREVKELVSKASDEMIEAIKIKMELEPNKDKAEIVKEVIHDVFELADKVAEIRRSGI